MIIQKYKIVFAGSMGAGKTEAIKSLSEVPVLATEAFNTDDRSHKKLNTTVGIDYGEVTLDDGSKVGLYGTPGQGRFDFMWGVICKGAIGTILLIDHSLATPLDELEYYLNIFKQYGENIVIGVTHIDDDMNKPTHQYRQWLMERDLNLPVFFIDARKKADVLLLLETLITTLEVKYL
ncbi:GTP-binding protein [Acinetobacter guillouiae]|jgi:signal recognition particle receptor subunit beta|uniref:GTP-binding protein n=1 Tax=Acinetobacter guillouiae TaxID=106649 RepID=A0A8X8GE21_ACIGI|nr:MULTISPECIES: GTP-binding protein [Acinetobacter]MDN5491316.1 GTP-binding protein [Acinetobacter sp.]MCF0263088.1 GTP-binding protein [Acinetobacter guillouiae]MCS4298313.1 signal recognition particle receptor subunit beta [Acinetobacter guillouiae]MCW2251917.1 signal recognition particle receptor subunit beta [Acinetobacter sp. BIGb0204]MDN5625596.1 GTP-binding protein [Acinetobacter sp.]